MNAKYVVCIAGDDEFPPALETRKIYRALPDDSAAKYGLIRVIDESDEDYLYPHSRFIPIELTAAGVMNAEYVVCIHNGGYLVSLEVQKIYRTLPDADANKHGMIRIIDETAEDYLFPQDWFVPVALSVPSERQLEVEQALAIPY